MLRSQVDNRYCGWLSIATTPLVIPISDSIVRTLAYILCTEPSKWFVPFHPSSLKDLTALSSFLTSLYQWQYPSYVNGTVLQTRFCLHRQRAHWVMIWINIISVTWGARWGGKVSSFAIEKHTRCEGRLLCPSANSSSDWQPQWTTTDERNKLEWILNRSQLERIEKHNEICQSL